MSRKVKDYSLSIVLAILFVASWMAQAVFQGFHVANEARAHGQAFDWNEFWMDFGAATFENWQSEFLQLLTFVTLTSFLIHKGSPESKDGDEEMKAMLERIEKAVTSESPSS